MTVEIKSEDEQIIAEKLRTGEFRSVDELIHRALLALGTQSSAASPNKKETLSEFLENSPLAGLDLQIERDPDIGRSSEL